MFLYFKQLSFKPFTKFTHLRSSFLFSGNKRPFEREIRDSPINRKPSSFWDVWPKQPLQSQSKEQVPPIKQQVKQSVIHATPSKPKEGNPVDSNVAVPGTPIQQKAAINQKQINPNFTPQPLDFTPFQAKKISDTVLSDFKDIQQKLNNQAEAANTVVMSNIGLNRYLTRIYITSGTALMITLASSYACIAFPAINAFADCLLVGGGIVSFLSFQKAQAIKPKFFEQKLKGDTIYRTQNEPARLAMFGVGCIAMGLSASPLFMAVQEVSSSILPMTMGVTAAIFGGASLMGLLMPKSKMLGYGGILSGSLLGLVGLNASGMLAAKFLGITLFANTLTTPESYLGIGIFTLMIIYDTHQAIKRYERGDADHLGMSIQILLDIWNLIIAIAKEIAKAKANKLNDKNDKKQ